MIIPNKKIKTIKKQFLRYEIPTVTPKTLTYWKKAKGIHVWDFYNKKLIDFTSTIFVSNIGHSNSNFIKDVKKTLDSQPSHTYNYYHSNRLKYSRDLIKFVNNKKLDKCYLLSSGSEATEASLKLMRLSGTKSKKNKDKKGIIALKGNWHGRTMGAQMMSGKNKQSGWIGFHDKNIYHLDFPYPWEVDENNSEKFFYQSLNKTFKKKFNYSKKICGFILEAFQGWGALFYPLNYIKAIKRFCKKNKIIITIDEMQSGFGRTGYKFLHEYYNLNPDIMCCGKAMGSGIPISGVISNSKIFNLPEEGDMSSTHSANPLACSAGLATLNEIKNKNLVSKSKKLGLLFEKKLTEIKNNFPGLIKHVSCKGLIAAIIFNDYKKLKSAKIADLVCINSYQNGLLLVNTGRESIKLAPPLIIKKNDLLLAIKTLSNSIRKFY